MLWTKSIAETIAFYEEILGFSSRTRFPDFVLLSRDDNRLMFSTPQEEPEDCKDPNDTEPLFPKPCLTGNIYIFVDEVDAFWEMVKNKARVKTAIADRAYLMRDFSILDNNGYELVFGEDISHSQPIVNEGVNI